MLFGLIVLRARTGNMLLVSLGLLVDARSCLLGVLFRRFQVSSRHRSLGPSRWRYEVIFWKAVCCSHGWFRNLIWCDLEMVVIFCSFSHHSSCNALWMSLRLHWGLMASFEYVTPKWLNANPCSFWCLCPTKIKVLPGLLPTSLLLSTVPITMPNYIKISSQSVQFS